MTTIHDVARRAGVSPVTVSRVINGAMNVNITTREKVELAIKELGYLPNLAARSLRSRQTSTLALIVPDITNAFWTTAARGVEDAAQAEGYSVLLCNSDESLTKQKGYINAVLQQRVDGVIIAPHDADARNLSQLRDLKTPTVVLDRRVVGWEVDSVVTDSVSGAFVLTQHLISLGHRQIAVISGPSVTSTAEERVAGYCLALKEAGISIDPRLIRRGEYRVRSGRMLTDQLFAEELNPTAIVAANNVMAMGVLEALQDHGKIVPQDVALVCFDDLPDLARFFPFLTVIVQPAYDLGFNAAQLLLSRIDTTGPMRPRQVVLPSRLVLRYSCGRFLNKPGVKGATLNPLVDQSESILVKSLAPDQLKTLDQIVGLDHAALHTGSWSAAFTHSDANRLHKVLACQEVDRLPFIEPHITSKAVLEYVLERTLPYQQAGLSSGKQLLSPIEAVEFARRVGLDAVACEMNWLPGSIETGDLLDPAAVIRQTFPPPALTEHFNRLESFLRAAQGSQVGVYASFSSFFDTSLRIARVQDVHEAFSERRPQLERLIDMLLAYQEKVLHAICDRFSTDLVLVLVRESLFRWPGMTVQSKIFRDVALPRLKSLIAPAKEHNLLTGISMPSIPAAALPAIQEAGFNLAHVLDPEQSNLLALRDHWCGQMVLAGGIPDQLLVAGQPDLVEEQVDKSFTPLVKGGSFVVSSLDGIHEGVRPENFMAFVRAIHRLG